MQSDGTAKNVGYITTAPHYLSDASGNPRKKVREAGKEIYAGIAVPAELLEALSEVRLEESGLRIEWRVSDSR
jgi:hypothetical protein